MTSSNNHSSRFPERSPWSDVYPGGYGIDVGFDGDDPAGVFPTEIISVCPDAVVVSVEALDARTIRVTFAAPMIDNVALRNPNNYTFTPSLTVSEVEPEAAINPTYVDLHLATEMRSITYNYDFLTIHAVDLDCSGDLTLTAQEVDSTHVRITFSNAVENNGALRDPLHYSVSPMRAVSAVVVENDTQVLITLQEMLQDEPYSIEIFTMEAA
jgi:hypothetical protein